MEARRRACNRSRRAEFLVAQALLPVRFLRLNKSALARVPVLLNPATHELTSYSDLEPVSPSLPAALRARLRPDPKYFAHRDIRASLFSIRDRRCA